EVKGRDYRGPTTWHGVLDTAFGRVLARSHDLDHVRGFGARAGHDRALRVDDEGPLGAQEPLGPTDCLFREVLTGGTEDQQVLVRRSQLSRLPHPPQAAEGGGGGK